MTATAFLLPHFALKFPTRSRFDYLFTFLLQIESLHMNPHITQDMFHGTNGTISYVLRKVLRMSEDLCFGKLWQRSDRVEPVNKGQRLQSILYDNAILFDDRLRQGYSKASEG